MKSSAAVNANRGFDPDIFLATIGDGRKILFVPKKQAIFAQGDDADSIFYIQQGKVRLTVVSQAGKEATIAIVASGISLARAPSQARSCAWVQPRP